MLRSWQKFTIILIHLICVPHHTWTIKKIYIVDFSGLKCDVVGKLGRVKLLGIFVVILQKAIKKTSGKHEQLGNWWKWNRSGASKYRHVHSMNMKMHYFMDLSLWSSNRRHWCNTNLGVEEIPIQQSVFHILYYPSKQLLNPIIFVPERT